MAEQAADPPAVVTPEAMQALAQRLVDDALARGASAAEAAIGSGFGLSAEVRNGEVETIEQNRGNALGLTVYHGKRKGSATSNDFSERALAETLEAALTIAHHSEEDEHAGLAEARFLAREVPDLDLDHPAALTPVQLVEIARTCEQAALALDERISNTEGASCSSDRSSTVYANSEGFAGGWIGTRYSLGASVLTGRGETMQRAHWYDSGRVFEALGEAEAVGRRAGERAIARIGSRKIASCTAPVVFEAPVAASLFSHLVSAISGNALYRRATFLVDAIGTRLFPEALHIRERPHLPRGPASAPFDTDGVATRDRDIVAEGRLVSYALSAYSARRLGLEPTGNAGGMRNLDVAMPDAAPRDLDAMLAALDTGLLVTGLMGFGVNQVTGDYSRGAHGFWVENGEIAYPVEEITIAGNLRDMFAGIRAVGRDVDRRGNIHCGSVLVDRMSIAGD